MLSARIANTNSDALLTLTLDRPEGSSPLVVFKLSELRIDECKEPAAYLGSLKAVSSKRTPISKREEAISEA